MLTGKNYWELANANGKLPTVSLADGPNGLRKQDVKTEDMKTKSATAMPNVSLLACTWEPELAYLAGETIADECLEQCADVLLGPALI